MDDSLYYNDISWATNNTWSLGNNLNNTLSGGITNTTKGGSTMSVA